MGTELDRLTCKVSLKILFYTIGTLVIGLLGIYVIGHVISDKWLRGACCVLYIECETGMLKHFVWNRWVLKSMDELNRLKENKTHNYSND